jgi:tRNA-2-methylthio-N6-dimethylallyladenosine synthase
MAERLKEKILDEYPEVDVVVGTFSKRELLAAVHSAEAKKAPIVSTGREEYSFAGVHSTGGIKAFVPIMHGCNNWCSYCIVPSVRGPEVSRPPEEILAEMRLLDRRGTREVTLLGQNVNSYTWQGSGIALSFADLLGMIKNEAGSIRWLRFLTSHPKDFSESLLAVMSESPLFCRHVHLPLQSGSTKILGFMNRGYTAEEYLSLVGRIRAALTGVSITTDILIGFPGESELDFEETVDLIKEIGFDDAFTYYYNPREGTSAFTMPDPVPGDVKKARLRRIIDAQRSKSAKKAQERIGKEVEVLVEGVSKKDPSELLARTEWDAMVVFAGSRTLIGQFTRVRLCSLSGTTFRAASL